MAAQSSNIHAYPTPAITPPHDNQDDLLVLTSSRAVLPDGDSLVLSPATITISKSTGLITSILPSVLPASSFPAGSDYQDHTPHILMPGLVDAHVHLNEPGRTEWEGFYTGTRAAASGGVTTVIDMPLNAIPPTTTLHGLQEKVKAAEGQCFVDVGFYGGIIPGNASELLPLVEAGVRGFKGFLIESGVDEFPAVSSSDVSLAMTTLKGTPTTLMFHAEMIPPITTSVGDDVQISLPPMVPTGPLNAYSTFLASRPSSFETYAISEILSLAHLAPDLQLHIVHLSATEAIPLLRAARESGIKISAETCYHYLSLAAEEVTDGDTRHKCCPPIRSEANRQGLWKELMRSDSVIQTVVSDHSPCTPELKLLPAHLERPRPSGGCCGSTGGTQAVKIAGVETPVEDEVKEKGDFFASWGGISSVGLGLPILWTTGTAEGLETKIDVLDVVRWCAVNTAGQVGLSHKKGALKAGMDGDVCIFDDEGTFEVKEGNLLFRNKVSPYVGRTLKGVVKNTFVRGQQVYGEKGIVEGAKGTVILEKRIC